jgi:cephalosporin hydroxylase
MKAIEQYIAERNAQVKENCKDKELEVATYHFTEHLVRTNFTKNFTWMGVPVLQYPSDLMVMQELIFSIKPDVIIETGIAFGGMTLFYRNMLTLSKGREGGIVYAIDIDIRSHAYQVLNGWGGIRTFEGSSVDPKLYKDVENRIQFFQPNSAKILVSLDSNHTHEHVLQELNMYSKFVTPGSYIVVFDTAIETFCHLDKNQDRPWCKGNNPCTAVREFLKGNKDFEVDRDIEQRAVITAAPGGWLRRV